jgi:hypothetical protein
MANLITTGRAMISVTLDGSSDYITPENVLVERVYWIPVRATDVLIVREYMPGEVKANMPGIPLYSPAGGTIGALLPSVSIRYLVDQTASTTPTGNRIVFFVKSG